MMMDEHLISAAMTEPQRDDHHSYAKIQASTHEARVATGSAMHYGSVQESDRVEVTHEVL